jgi:hypothetical protein
VSRCCLKSPGSRLLFPVSSCLRQDLAQERWTFFDFRRHSGPEPRTRVQRRGGMDFGLRGNRERAERSDETILVFRDTCFAMDGEEDTSKPIHGRHKVIY